jgi:hypothetical protein
MARRDDDDAPKTVAVNNAYTGMLALSLLALLAGCALLYLDYSQYGSAEPKGIPKAPPPVQAEKKAPQ